MMLSVAQSNNTSDHSMQNGQVPVLRISVLLTPTKSGGNLCATLQSLLNDWHGGHSSQIVVIVPPNQKTAELSAILLQLKNAGISLSVIHTDSAKPADVPVWRAIAYAQAIGQACIFLEDNAIVAPGWWQAWSAWTNDASNAPIATGLVTPNCTECDAIELGVFYCEYGPFIPATKSGRLHPLKRVAGNHWAVNRQKIRCEYIPDSIDEHAWVHRYLNPGQCPGWNLNASVECRRSINRRDACFERIVQGFHFGMDQAQAVAFRRRTKMAGLGWAIVIIQICRLFGVVFQRKYQRLRFLTNLHVTFLLLLAWSLGEWGGWLTGTIGVFMNRQLKNRPEENGKTSHENAIHQQSVINTGQI